MNRTPSRSIRANNFYISRVANGWTVTMPGIYEDREPDMGRGMQEGFESILPVFKEMMKLKEQDPLLASLQHPEEDPEPEPEQPLPIIGREEQQFVCKTFQEVLYLLEEKFLDLDDEK